MNIFTKIKNSFYNKEYYKDTVLTESFGESVGYIVKVSLVLALLISIIFAFYIPKILSSMKDTVSSVVRDYPEDLVVFVNDGNATVNRPEPYFITARGAFEEDGSLEKDEIENMMVINTTESFNSLKFKEYKTFSLLTKNEIIIIGGNSEMKVIPLSSFGDVEITRSWVLEKQAWLFKVLPLLTIGMLVLIYMGVFFLEFIITMVSLLLFALIAWLILKIKRINVSYGRAYQVAVYAGTFMMFLLIIGMYFKPLNNIFLKLIIFIIIVYLNFDREKPILSKEEEKVLTGSPFNPNI